MADWELLDVDPFAGVKKWIAAGDEPDSAMVKTEFFGTQALLDDNKRAQNEDFDRRADMWHAASIPVEVMFKWLQDYGINAWNPNHMPEVRKLLNSSEWAYLKRAPIVI